MKEKVPGRFYREQIVKSEAPDYKNEFFEIERVIKEKKVKNKKFYLVKFLYYPNKFNMYVSEDDMKFGKDD